MSAESNGVAESDENIWADDLLNRKDFADFLTRTLIARTEAIAEKQAERGWAVSLDATWGAGKSFFVERWVRSLREQQHPVVYFDAWENDLGEEASIALMAEINDELNGWIKKLPKHEMWGKQARELTTRAKQKLRRSVMPVAKVIASGLLKKAIGAGLDEFAGVSDSSQSDSGIRVQDMKESADLALDKVFELSLEEHRRRKSNIREFKKALVDLINLVEREAGAKVPVFVFVDELDRCRPTYAISLLEEMKHVFGMEKVCFVVSTNLYQLKHSIGAVYGSGFNSEMYLKRFFDQSIGLPLASSDQHIDRLISYFEALSRKKHVSGLQVPKSKDAKSEAIGMIFSAFSVDPRSQRQIFRIADCVAASLEEYPVHTLYLFFLCALAHANQSLFDDLESNKIKAQDVFVKMGAGNPTIALNFRNKNTGRLDVRDESLSSVIDEYLVLSRSSIEDIRRGVQSHSRQPFQYISEWMQQEITGLSRTISVSRYFKLVRYAGYFSGEAIDS